ncbi:sirohydrochlorin chelatase [Streptomyces sp. RB6PN25]|uniref:Sirohydrochlorin chelatase n=1 Tax=Streptomyces humicola TaxID=2953240 RepID=A0ABT1PWG6_9ACTN|nr:CbiX/SirB N-terminal domain-containing protein [Streptomyces humicola]MCQ4082019.1 sirohydrochlorin chelatase [Streptomyces humicola]
MTDSISAVPPSTVPFDSTGRLMSLITAQLNTQLTRVSPPRRRPATLVAVGHGSRDPEASRTVRALLERVRALRPGIPLRLGHIELSEPLLSDTLASLRGEVVLVPLLLGRGYHVKHDLPEALARAPHLTGRIAAPLGPHPLLAEALHSRLVEAGFRRSRRAAVVLAAAGSRDPDSAADAARTAALLSARLDGLPVVPAVASAGGPTVADAVRTLVVNGSHRVAIASYFTAPGRFAAHCTSAAPWIAAAPLGAHDSMARLVLHRYDEALARRTASVAVA